MNNKEIERKFLVKILPENLEQYNRLEITQGYLAVSEPHAEIRLREVVSARGTAYYLTGKKGSGRIREEREVALTKTQFELLWPATTGRVLKKIRYRIPAGTKLTIELDCYQDLDNLAVAEVEFPSEEAGNNFVPPSWFGEEVTGRAEYKNQYLATLTGLADTQK